jgi:hypothetical protein
VLLAGEYAFLPIPWQAFRKNLINEFGDEPKKIKEGNRGGD